MDRYTDTFSTSTVSDIQTKARRRTRREDRSHTQACEKAQSKPSDAENRDGRPDTSNAADTISLSRNVSFVPYPSAAYPNYQPPTVKDEELSIKALKTFFSRFEEMQQLVGDAKQEMHNFSSLQNPMQVNSLKDKATKLEEKMLAMEKTHADKIDHIEKAYEDLKRSKEQIEFKNDELKLELEKAKLANNELVTQNNNITSENRLNQKELAKTKNDLNKVKAELSQSNSRLSRQMSNSLTENNPQIADLSDSNRPSKLGEKHSELYDNEWTDAYEVLELTCGGELNAIQKLFEILMDVNEFCKSKSEEQSLQLKQVSFMSNAEPSNLPDAPELKKQMKEFRKYTAELSVQALCKEYTRKTQSKQRELFADHRVCKYIDGCVKLCWLMNAHDPPVVFSPPVSPNSDFDLSIYKAYTESGSKVQFIVWPALHLHEGGPILERGVAQGRSPVGKHNNRASAHKATTHNNSPGRQNSSSDLGINSPKAREAWATDDPKQGSLISDLDKTQAFFKRGNDATERQTQKLQTEPGSNQQSAQLFPTTEDGNYGSDANVGRDVTNQSNTRNGRYVPDPFDQLAAFDNQSSNTKITDQPTRRSNAFSSSVTVPMSTYVVVPSQHDMEQFYSYMRYGEFSCRSVLGEATYNKCINYYNNVVLRNLGQFRT
ncbi:uncharacterized protein LOC127876540 isoform X1 [Dreissena polymorpha]|uniref:Mitochondria-eating protein C-terminal domain-containing protein n=1 Tax=Dreissena polymorpha TaxID=45954 RepID=A0A9D4KMR1_DREPO|nr:uncharacterized protein LOC127876540 isoform X1 [Dreissena polymorpha]XP_052277799.1 uncharacterized protein LOC127876540 isoform X1 [Dreissena polymorpha]XP_052277800.1 uncharacterized protein LOC127876540 isoform X1 [Dreissena polymorpha]XP_052277801.1 uncharacterized protein LOC127876540 isoform X1 [Dreissena polymorpha]XP_052277802.1 uncharacterized protein LOC127876540 isoform X1 [Dreissena polymorpha]KAH3842752.1 hypothetical protein DPMN_116256 [Dreissena polymorpha]